MKTKINLFGKKLTVISLNQDLCFDSKSYPGHPPVFHREIVSKKEKDGFENYVHQIADHSFRPHIDAPNHFCDTTDGAEVFSSTENMFHETLIIDLTTEDESEEIEGIRITKEILLKHIEPYQDKISEKSALILRTGYDKWTESMSKNEMKNIPYFSKEAATFISTFKNLKVVATDSINVDKHDENIIHNIFKEKMIVEGLVNLHKIKSSQHDKLMIMIAPLIIEGATAAPAKVYAFLKI